MCTGVETQSKAAVAAMAVSVFGERALGVQSPVHVGTNNFGFRGGQRITNLERRPAHVDSIVDYGHKGHPDFFFLCCRTASAEGGGASYLIDLEDCLAQIEPWAASALEGLEIVQRIELPPNYSSFSLPSGSDSDEETGATDTHSRAQPPDLEAESDGRLWKPGSKAGERVEQLFTRTTAGRKLLRVSSFSDAASLLEDMQAEVINLKPVPESASPDRDMNVVRQWLHAVAKAEENAPRFTLKEVGGILCRCSLDHVCLYMIVYLTLTLAIMYGCVSRLRLFVKGEAVLVDNYRCAHGRDGYTDLSRAMWQIWVWSDSCLLKSMPQEPGVGREWLPLDSMKKRTHTEPKSQTASKL